MIDEKPDGWPRWMNVKTAARYTDSSEPHIQSLRREGKLKAYRFGERAVRFDRDELDAYIASCTIG